MEEIHFTVCPACDHPVQIIGLYNKLSESDLALAILNILQAQFDRVIHVISRETGIIITENLARSMMEKYLAERGFLYVGANPMNVPWIFAYMSDSNSLYGRIIQQGSELAIALLEHVPTIGFNSKGQIISLNNSFLELNFCFIHHERHLENTSLYESMKFIVSQKVKGLDKIIYERKIVFAHMYFQNLIRPTRDDVNRNYNLLNLAKEKLTV